MGDYRCEPLAELARQLRYAPPGRRRGQIDRAERLYWELDDDRAYPLSFIAYRITGYRMDETDASRAAMVGAAVRDDLPTLVLALSATLDDTFDDHDPRPADLKALAARLHVTPRTVTRYRKQGLFARKLWHDTPKGPRQKLGFLESSVQRFIASRREQLDHAARFERIDDDTRHRMIVRARRIAWRTGCSPHRVARHLARKFGRSVEAIRLLLVQHDRQHPRFAIFTGHRPPLDTRQQRLALRAWRRGVPIRQMTRRYGKSRDALYRAIHLARRRELRRVDLSHVPSPTFDLPDAQRVILAPAAEPADDAAAGPAQIDRPALELLGEPLAAAARRNLPQPAVEQAMFVRYHYLKHRASQVIGSLDRYQPRPAGLDAGETFLRYAARVQRRLAMTYLQVVASAIGQHIGGRRADAAEREHLLALGAAELIARIDRFDAARGAPFANALRWTLMRRFARRGARSHGGHALGLMRRHARATPRLGDWLKALDDEQRDVIVHRFDLPLRDTSRPRTLADVTGRLGIATEHAARLERHGLARLRLAASADDLHLADALPLRLWPAWRGTMRRRKEGPHG